MSIAAVMQHNTSGFASLASLGVKSPADFEGLRYGAWGSAVGGSHAQGPHGELGRRLQQLQMVTTGFSDPLALLARGADRSGLDLLRLAGHPGRADGHRPGRGHDEGLLRPWCPTTTRRWSSPAKPPSPSRPDLVEALLEALSRGYTFSAEHPDEAAEILLAAVPELDGKLVRESQRWVSDYYVAEAARWGEQKESVWRDYAEWMFENGVVATRVAPQDAFTNQFLP